MPLQNKIKQVRDKLDLYDIDCFLIPLQDEFQNEYVPESYNRLKYITGFTGSNGLAVIAKDNALFFTDGRYLLQAAKELDSIFKIYNLKDLFIHLPKKRIGYDPKLHSISNIQLYKNYEMVSCDNLVDLMWQDRPLMSQSEVFPYPLKYAGESKEEKCKKLQQYLVEKQLDAIVITESDNICWLLNIRANDVPYNPILLSYLIFYQNGEMEIFSNAPEHSNINNFYLRLEEIKLQKIQINPKSASIAIESILSDPVLAEDPCGIAKACKNDVEIKRAKEIHVIDGVAVTKLLYWLEQNYHGQSELSIAAKLLELRKISDRFLYPSFSTISSFAENGAIIHYSVKEETNKYISGNGLFLLDSGGQYWGGTTDITRTILIGKATKEWKENFTLVLKGHIALANVIFPVGTTGEDLDCLARQFLWSKGLDYAHGTGHGVGNALSVHEGPQRISKYCKVQLKPGMLLSNEPGYYKNHEYGIRIENIMLVKEKFSGYLCMETLSLAPIDKRLIVSNMLTDAEQKWLEDYHKLVYKKLSPFLSAAERRWLSGY
jgi:Xaa-Pro aminopeptidase